MSDDNNDLPQKIWAVYDNNEKLLNMLISPDYQTAFANACRLLQKKPEDINVIDTGRVKHKCCR